MKLQAQAVLRREDLTTPLRLVGVLMAGSFHPLTAQDAWGPLHLEVGLVALTPLTAVIASDMREGAADAMVEARDQWSDPASADGAHLSWVPIDQMRDVAEEDIRALIALMSIANDERVCQTPSTPHYQRAARELGRLAALVCEVTSAEERMAEDEALRKRDERGDHTTLDALVPALTAAEHRDDDPGDGHAGWDGERTLDGPQRVWAACRRHDGPS